MHVRLIIRNVPPSLKFLISPIEILTMYLSGDVITP